MKVGRPFFCGEFDERIKPAKSFYGSHAIARTFLEIPRGSSANAKTFFFRFAELPQTPKHIPRDLREYPQTPKHFPWDLRDSRKRQGISHGTCGIPANAKAFPARLAGVPANAKANAAKLAGVPANAKAFPVGLAELPRDKSTLAAYSARSKTFSRDKEPLPLTHVVYEITHFLLAIACKMRLKSHRQSEMRRKTRFACRRQVEMRFSGLIPYVCP